MFIINEKLSEPGCLKTDKEKEEMAKYTYCEVVRKFLYLIIATCPDIAYTVSVLF